MTPTPPRTDNEQHTDTVKVGACDAEPLYKESQTAQVDDAADAITDDMAIAGHYDGLSNLNTRSAVPGDKGQIAARMGARLRYIRTRLRYLRSILSKKRALYRSRAPLSALVKESVTRVVTLGAGAIFGKTSLQARKDERISQTEAIIAALPAGMPLPVALARFAAHAGTAEKVTDTALIREFGENPGQESARLCAAALGLELSQTLRDLTRLPEEQFPLIGVSVTGGAFIIQFGPTKGRYSVIGADRRCEVSGEDISGFIQTAFVTSKSDKTLEGDDTVGLRNAGGLLIPPLQNRLFGRSTERPDADDGGIVKWLFAAMWRHNRGDFGHLLAAAMISNLFLIALPLFIMSVYDRVVPHSAFESLQTLAIGIFVIFAADLGLRSAKTKFTDAIGLSISHQLQMTLYRHLLRLKLSRKPASSAALTNIQGEVETICLLLPEFSTALIADTLIALIVLAIIASIGGPVVFAPLCGMVLIASVIYMTNLRASSGLREATNLKTRAAAQLGETFDALTSVKSSGAEHMLLKKYEKTVDLAAIKSHQARQYGKFSHNLLAILIQSTIVATLILGVLRIDAGAMTIGSLAAITILVGRGLMPVGQMVDQYCRLCALQTVLTPYLDLTNHEEDQGGESTAISQRLFRGEIKCRNISYSYENARAKALEDITLTINPGEKIGIVGKNGSGKTTLLHLLPRLYSADTGIITIDEHDIRQYSPRYLRQKIGFLPQETVLFNATLRHNICLGNESYTEEQFERAIYISGVYEFARKHPEGYNMSVGPRGEFLSSGERQAVGLARLFLDPKPVLILDEPSSMLDQNAEGRLVARMSEHLKDSCLIICTHRTKMLKLVDRIIVLSNGKIVKDGEKSAILYHGADPGGADPGGADPGGADPGGADPGRAPRTPAQDVSRSSA